MVFHVLNRRADRKTLFYTDSDYRAFEMVLEEVVAFVGIRLCAYCLMPNHWHLVLWPLRNHEMSCFMHRVTVTHSMRWKTYHDTIGTGHLYQSRYKSFPVQSDEHYLTVVRYVERNALRANLVERAEDWPFSSLWRRQTSTIEDDPLLSPGPFELPDDWVERVNRADTSAELEALRRSLRQGKPYGEASWIKKTSRELELAVRPRGRPRKSSSALT
jgi:putative transposase